MIPIYPILYLLKGKGCGCRDEGNSPPEIDRIGGIYRDNGNRNWKLLCRFRVEGIVPA